MPKGKKTVNKEIPTTSEATDKKVYNSNLIKNVEYSSEDLNEILPQFAVVGRPNAGKSSLINSIIDNQRHIVSDIPGTTRDSCLLYTSPSPRDRTRSRMPSSA